MQYVINTKQPICNHLVLTQQVWKQCRKLHLIGTTYQKAAFDRLLESKALDLPHGILGPQQWGTSCNDLILVWQINPVFAGAKVVRKSQHMTLSQVEIEAYKNFAEWTSLLSIQFPYTILVKIPLLHISGRRDPFVHCSSGIRYFCLCCSSRRLYFRSGLEIGPGFGKWTK